MDCPDSACSPAWPDADRPVFYYNSEPCRFNTAFIGKTEEELAASEHNVDAVLHLALRFPDANTTALRSLACDLKQVYDITRRKMDRHRMDPAAEDDGDDDEPLPPAFASREHNCLCPLTLLLRSVAATWNARAHVSSSPSSPADSSWGELGGLRAVLVDLKDSLLQCSGPVSYPGLANCILFHAENGRYTVASSAARYKNLRGMREYALDVKKLSLARLLQQCAPASRERIDRIQSASLDFYSHLRVPVQSQDDAWRAWVNPFDDPSNSLQMGGLAATFNTIGEYKASCLLDCHRIQVQRPPAAQLAEDHTRVEDRRIFPIQSCAEYELLVMYETKMFL